ncbi:MAG: YbbR-like domain-containing protein [Candidatus Fimivivens sp.]
MKNNKSFLNNNTVLIVLSVLSAILIWVMVAHNVDSKIQTVIRNVPVTLDTSDSNLKRLDLYPVTDTEFIVDVEVSGSRATVGNIKASELSVLAKLNNISGPGTYDLTLEITDTRHRDIEIKGTAPDVISMRFDHRAAKTLPVQAEISGLNIPDGYILDEEYIYPSEIQVIGPATEMATIDSANVYLNFEKPLSASATSDTPVVLEDADGNEISSPYFEYDSKTVSVTLPVLKKKTVPVTFDFVNVPPDFDIETLKYVISPAEIEIAGPADLVASYNELHLGYLDMRNIAPDMQMFYDLALPPSFISVEGVDELSIEFLPEGFAKKELDIESSGIYIINRSDAYDITVQSKNIPNVTVYGPADVLDVLTSKDLVAQIDMTQADLRTGQITVPVDILIPGKRTCWAYGDRYTARITVKSK